MKNKDEKVEYEETQEKCDTKELEVISNRIKDKIPSLRENTLENGLLKCSKELLE